MEQNLQKKNGGDYALKLLEAFAVIFNLLYTYLYIKESMWCWGFAFLGSALFVFLCWKKKLLAETALQVFYIAFAVYGFLQLDAQWIEQSWGLAQHLIAIVGGTLMVFIVNHFLKKHSDARMPLVDSFTTVFSLIATWIMVNYIHENWLYWMVVDTVAIYLYASRKMYFGAFLFIVYLFLAINGYWELNWI